MMPSIPEIQRINAVLVTVSGIALLFRSPIASLSCVLGGVVVIANLFLLSLLGKVLLAGAAKGASSALGAVAIPLKLLLIVTLIYLVFARARIDGIGFAVGVTTQLIAVLIATARARKSGQTDVRASEEAKL